MKHSLEIRLFRVNGLLDSSTTLEKVKAALEVLESNERLIPLAVDQFLSDNPGLKGLNLSAIGSIVCHQYLKVSYDAVAETQKSIEDFVRQSDKFWVARGRQADGSGACRVVKNMSPAEIKHMTEQKAKEAAQAAKEASETATA